MFELDGNLAIEYLQESQALLATVEADLRAIEDDSAAIDEGRVDRVFRAVHSIKGGAGFFELAKIRELAHQSEAVLSLVRSRSIVPTAGRVRVLKLATRRLGQLLERPATSNQADVAELLAELAGLGADHRATGRGSGTSMGPELQPARGLLRMLLVEDDFVCRLLLQSFLSRYGECHIAVHGREAVEVFGAALNAGKSYDLICMDLMMPEMNGREAVRRVRALEAARGILPSDGTRIFMTTSVSDAEEIALCFKELCDAYLIKPIDLGKLLGEMEFYRLLE